MKPNPVALPGAQPGPSRGPGATDDRSSRAGPAKGRRRAVAAPAAACRVDADLPRAWCPAETPVLIVDADTEAAELLATLLRLSDPGIVAMCAHTIDTAVMLAAEHRPDVLIFDLGTRAMSGELVVGAVLAACPGKRPLMIALSGGAAEVRERGLAHLVDHVLPKPFELPHLIGLIGRRPVPARPH